MFVVRREVYDGVYISGVLEHFSVTTFLSDNGDFSASFCIDKKKKNEIDLQYD